MRIELVCRDPEKQVGGADRVGVAAGSEAEAHWLSLGYVPDDAPAPVLEEAAPVAAEETTEATLDELRKEYRQITGKPPGRRSRTSLEAAIAEAKEEA